MPRGASRFPTRGTNEEHVARARGLNSQPQQASSSLPSHTQQIMEAFLWNKKNTTKMEQRHQTEVQSLILSRIRRPAAQPREEVQTPMPRQQRAQPANINATPMQIQQRAQPANNNASKNPFWNTASIPRQERAQTVKNLENPVNNQHNWNTANQQATMNHRVHSRNTEAGPQPQPTTYDPLNIQIEEEDDDIVCCDGGSWQEGTKNLCTITLWALIVLAIVNRLFVHMAMKEHRKGNAYVGLREIQPMPNNATMVDFIEENVR